MKGSMLDLPVIMALMLSGAIMIWIVYLILSSMYAAWPVGGESLDILETGIQTFSLFDTVFLMLAVGLGMFTIVSAFFIDSHPVFFVFSALIMLPIVILTSAQITNVFVEFATAVPFQPVTAEFPFIYTIMINLPLFMLVIGIFTAIVMHSKSGGMNA